MKHFCFNLKHVKLTRRFETFFKTRYFRAISMFLFFQLIYQSGLQYELFYESMIDIESLMFLVEINNLNLKNTMSIVDDIVLPTRKHIFNVIETYKDRESRGVEGGNGLNKNLKTDVENKTQIQAHKNDDEKAEYDRNKAISNMQYSVEKIENSGVFSEVDGKDNPVVDSFDDEVTNNMKYFKDENIKGPKIKDFKTDLLTLLTIFENFAFPLSNHLSIKKNIELRNILFEKDKSQIAKKIYVKKLQNLKKSVQKLRNEELIDKLELDNPLKKDIKYKKMVSNLYKVVISKENFVKSLKREITEFIQSFEKNITMTDEDLRDLMMFVNLGGNFVDPRLLIYIVRELMIPNKKRFIEKIANSLLKPIDTLTMYTRYKNCSEKKDALKRFLCNSMKNTPSNLKNQMDEAFKSRSYLLEKYLKDDPEDVREKKLKDLDNFQDKTTKKVYEKVKLLDSEKIDLFFIFNKDLLDAYVRFLLNGTKKDKASLIKFFEF